MGGILTLVFFKNTKWNKWKKKKQLYKVIMKKLIDKFMKNWSDAPVRYDKEGTPEVYYRIYGYCSWWDSEKKISSIVTCMLCVFSDLLYSLWECDSKRFYSFIIGFVIHCEWTIIFKIFIVVVVSYKKLIGIQLRVQIYTLK